MESGGVLNMVKLLESIVNSIGVSLIIYIVGLTFMYLVNSKKLLNREQLTFRGTNLKYHFMLFMGALVAASIGTYFRS